MAEQPLIAFPSTWAARTPAKPAVLVVDQQLTVVQSLTYQQLEERSVRFAHLLRAEGLVPGDHLAVLLENRAEVFEVCWAALRIGLYVTLINTQLGAEEAGYIVDDCDARALVTSTQLGSVATELLGRTPKVRRRWVVDGPLAGHDDYPTALAAAPSAGLVDECEGETMLYSSGTTGRPKGVKRPLPATPLGEHFRLAGVFERTGFDQDSVYLSPAPLYHAAPLSYTTSVHRAGGTVVVMRRFAAEGALALIQRHQVTHAQFVPTMFVRMLRLPAGVRARYDTASLRAAIHAAAPCPVPLKRQMIDWWGPVLWEYYAGTEGNGVTLISSPEWLERPGSVGRPFGCEVHIADESGRELGPGQVGTIYFAGGRQFEYHNDPDKTAHSRHPRGWSTLGDVGHLDKDGYLYLTDRQSHLIISGGVNIYPQETENLLAMHPSVADVAVIGAPDEEMGELVKAVVQPLDPSEAGPALAEELISYCRRRLAHYKCPRVVEFTPALPRQDNGKLYKRLL